MRSDHSGFTLPELLLVMAIVAVLLAAGIPVLNTVANQYTLILAAQGIATQMQYARMKAVASNEPFSVDFTTSPNFYQVETGFGGTTFAGPFFYPYGVSLNYRIGGNPITFPGGSVTFLPTGNLPSTGNGSTGRVRLINRSDVMIDIVVSNGGMIRQTPPYKELPPPF